MILKHLAARPLVLAAMAAYRYLGELLTLTRPARPVTTMPGICAPGIEEVIGLRRAVRVPRRGSRWARW